MEINKYDVILSLIYKHGSPWRVDSWTGALVYSTMYELL